jgi:rare lipoprotein A
MVTKATRRVVLVLALAALGAVAADAMPRQQTGLASWYGSFHHGRTTASGERFDMHALTAAHRTLPLGSRIEVTNLENNRSIELRVNDRGPFVGNRILDVSRAAAQRLGAVDAGVVRVHVRVLDTPDEPRFVGAPSREEGQSAQAMSDGVHVKRAARHDSASGPRVRRAEAVRR